MTPLPGGVAAAGRAGAGTPLRRGLLVLLLPGLLSACAGPSSSGTSAPAAAPAVAAPAARPAAAPGPGAPSLIATPRQGDLAVSPVPGAAASSRLPATTEEGSPRAVLVTEDRGDWLRVALPGRPNGRTGWVRADDVQLAATDWRLEVSLSARRLRVFRGLMQVAEHPVGVGKSVTPTPRGTYYVTDLLRPPDPEGPYGPYAFGLSAYSEVLTSFAGGKGQIGLHGNDDPASVGRNVSAGCLRLHDEVVRELAGQLPLGTPVVISA